MLNYWPSLFAAPSPLTIEDDGKPLQVWAPDAVRVACPIHGETTVKSTVLSLELACGCGWWLSPFPRRGKLWWRSSKTK